MVLSFSFLLSKFKVLSNDELLSFGSSPIVKTTSFFNSSFLSSLGTLLSIFSLIFIYHVILFWLPVKMHDIKEGVLYMGQEGILTWEEKTLVG